ncbi:unknown [Prevotella sp. CAG:487]|nr:unknown [Prevotella sp. CAG:487]
MLYISLSSSCALFRASFQSLISYAMVMQKCAIRAGIKLADIPYLMQN